MKNVFKYMKQFSIVAITILLLFGQVSCKKFITIEAPANSTNAANVYTDDAMAAAVLTGIYANLSKGNSSSGSFEGGGDFTSISLFAGMSADELTLYDPTKLSYFLYYSNSLLANPGIGTANYWNTIYPYIFVVNSAIEGLTNSGSLTPAVKQQLLGEAKFIRAFCYFYLVNLYGDVPLAVSSDWQVNATLPRAPKADVYRQIISDLKEAEDLLSANYLNSDVLTPTTARVRPNKWVATALLARAYLFANDFANSEIEASKIITNPSFQLLPLNGVFLKDSKETIWALQAVGTGTNSNTGEGKLFILPSGGPTSAQAVYLSRYLLNSFEAGDQRKTNWINSVTPSLGTFTFYFPYKYKIGAVNTTSQEYCVVLRLAEQYLIRAEARAQQNKLSEAVADLDSIRKRAGLPMISVVNPGINQPELLEKILHERQVELFTEWGHRWLDLKRTKNVDVIMSPITPSKGGSWQTTDQLYPIPQSEMDKAPQYIQNMGY